MDADGTIPGSNRQDQRGLDPRGLVYMDSQSRMGQPSASKRRKRSVEYMDQSDDSDNENEQRTNFYEHTFLDQSSYSGGEESSGDDTMTNQNSDFEFSQSFHNSASLRLMKHSSGRRFQVE